MMLTSHFVILKYYHCRSQLCIVYYISIEHSIHIQYTKNIYTYIFNICIVSKPTSIKSSKQCKKLDKTIKKFNAKFLAWLLS